MYAFDLLMCAVAFAVLQQTLIRADQHNAPLARAVQGGLKEKASMAAYVAAVLLPFLGQMAAYAAGLLLLGVALSWTVPDRRIERVLAEAER